LDVADPEVSLGVFKDHFKIDAGQARGKTGSGDGGKTGERIHKMDIVIMSTPDRLILGCRVGGSGLNLDDSYADSQKKQREPFYRVEFSAEEHDGEGGGGEDFHLVGDLKGGDG